VTSIYSILSTLNSLEPKQQEVSETHEPVEAKGSIKEGIAARLEAQLREFKETVAEGEVCPQCDSEPCQCEEMEEGNEFSGALAKAKAAGEKEFEVDGKKYQVESITEGFADFFDKKMMYKKAGATVDGREDDYTVTFPDGGRKRFQNKDGRRVVTALEPVDRPEEIDGETGEVVKRGRGRPKGTGRKMGAKGPSLKSRLLADVHEGKYVPDDVHINPDEKFAKEKAASHNKAVEKAKQMAASRPKEQDKTVNEARLIDEDGNTLQHILDRFPAEVKAFEQGGDLEGNLYDALYDYYLSSGEMPYGTAKARSGDPYEWVTERLIAELNLEETTTTVVVPEPSTDLADIAKLAGLKESCGAMASAGKPEINVSTNYNSADGNKSITITAQGDSAAELAQMLKLSGLMGDAPAHEPQVAIVAAHPEHETEVEEERDIEYANTPDEETAGVDAVVTSGDDLHKSKGANPNWQGDNPMRTTQFEDNDPVAKLGRDLMKEYESIKISK
jgi:hypothetical protein